jgi:putative phosphoesterase
MLIGIISDSHDNIWNLAKVFERLKALKVEVVIHCGDFSAPFVLKDLDTLGIPVHGVFGNVDADHFEMARLSFTQLQNVTLHGDIAELNLGGLRIAVNHYPKIAEALAQSGNYDVVAYGHTHIVDNRTIGKCLLINPGEVMGRKGIATFATLDTQSRTVEIHTL